MNLEVGAKIKQLRLARGMTQEQLIMLIIGISTFFCISS